jgi:hypothetical protein
MQPCCDALLKPPPDAPRMGLPRATGRNASTPRHDITNHVRNALAQLAGASKSWRKILLLCMSILASNCNHMSSYFRDDDDKSFTGACTSPSAAERANACRARVAGARDGG